MKKRLFSLYNDLFKLFGPQNWWPGDSPWEICVGAILTQNTNWKNVEKAISNLKKSDYIGKGEGIQYSYKMLSASDENIADLIRPSGYFNLKTGRLKAFAEWWNANTKDDLPLKFNKEMNLIRNSLLKVYGIGPETADSILLYAFNLPSFVVDTYTKRICSVYFKTPIDIEYNQLRSLFMDNLPSDYQLFNEYHALLVRLGKEKEWKKILKSI